MNEFFLNEMQEHAQVVQKATATLQNEFTAALNLCLEAIKSGGKLLFFGNGGSAADAQHLATELTVRYINDRPPIAAIALTTDSSCLTAIGNDFGYDAVFARQISALGRPNDVAIAISTSGNSANVINGIAAARTAGIKVIGLTNQDGGKMVDLCDVVFRVPSKTTSRVQEIHITIGHMLCGAIEKKLGLA